MCAERDLVKNLYQEQEKNSAVPGAQKHSNQKKKINVNFAKISMSKIKKTFLVLLSLLFVPLIILFSFNLFVFNEKYYEKEFVKTGVYEKYQKEDVKNAVDELFGYFKDKNDLKTQFFNQKEKEHLKDVKNIIQKIINLFYFVLVASTAAIIYFLIHKKYFEIGKILMRGSIFSILTVITFLSFSIMSFSSSFYLFHVTFFKNNLWMLNPETDNLINLFPEQFFFDIMKEILVASFSISILFLILGAFLIKRYKGQPVISDKRSKD